MHESLINELAQINALIVISKRSMQRFKDSELSTSEIAEQLGVSAIVETSVSKVDSLVQLKVNLVRAFPDERQLLSNAFSRDFTHILDLYRDVTSNIVKEMNVALLPDEAERLLTSEIVNPEAYAYYSHLLMILKRPMQLWDIDQQ